MRLSELTNRIRNAQVLKGGVPCLEVAVPHTTTAAADASGAGGKSSGTGGAGGAGTAVLTLVYDKGMEAWMRVNDSRYALSDFAALVRREGGKAGVDSCPLPFWLCTHGLHAYTHNITRTVLLLDARRGRRGGGRHHGRRHARGAGAGYNCTRTSLANQPL